MGVATGSAIVSTWFDVPTDLETGDSKLEVVANGIPSLPMNITVVLGGVNSELSFGPTLGSCKNEREPGL